MARGDDDSSNRTRGRRKSPFPPLRLVQDLPDSDDAAPRSPSGAGKSSGGARVAKPRPSAQAGRSAHPSQGSVRAGAANGSKRAGQGATSGRQAASGQARKPHPAKGGLGQAAASRNAQGRPAQKNSSQGAAGSKAAESKSAGQKGSTQNGSPRGAQRSAGRGGHSPAQARSGQGRSSQARSGQVRAAQSRAGQPSNAQRSQGQPAVRTGQAGNAQRAAQGRSAQSRPGQGHSGQARSGQGRTSQPRSSQGRATQGRATQARAGQGAASRTGAASTARRGAAGGQRQNPRKQAQGAANRRVNAPGARPSRPQSQAPERRHPPVTRPKKPPRQPMDPALKASLMRLGRNVFLVVLTVVLVVWGFNYVTETVRVQNLQAARQNQGSGMPTPLACDAKNLDVTVTLPAQVARGQALTVSLKVANKANIPCIFDVGSAHLQMRVTSGTDTVYDGATCKTEPSSRKMLLAPLTAKAAGESAYVSANPTPDSFTTSVSWSGQRYKADCSSAGPSQAGTYVLRLNLDGKELVGQQVFIVK